MTLIRFRCQRSLNTKEHGAKSVMTKASCGRSAAKSGMAMAIAAISVAAIPVAPPMSACDFLFAFYRN